MYIYEPKRHKTNLRECASNEDSIQPTNSRKLIRIFRRILDSHGCKISSCGQRRLKSDCTDAQSDLSLRWTHMSKGTFSNVTGNIKLFSICTNIHTSRQHTHIITTWNSSFVCSIILYLLIKMGHKVRKRAFCEMCTQKRRKSACAYTQPVQSLLCLHEEMLCLWPSKMRPENILIRLRMKGLIWIFAGRTFQNSKVRFLTLRLKSNPDIKIYGPFGIFRSKKIESRSRRY